MIVEPVAGNMGVVLPLPGYLQGLRALTAKHGALLVFDEVMTGWRVHRQGAQVLHDIEPDLTCLGKVLGGGLPAAAYGGRAALHAAGGARRAGLPGRHTVGQPAGHGGRDRDARCARGTGRVGTRPSAGLRRASSLLEAECARAGIPVVVNRVGTMFTPFFTAEPVTDYDSARRADRAMYARFFHAMLANGVYLAPSAFEAAFTSVVHGEDELDQWKSAVEASVAQLQERRT